MHWNHFQDLKKNINFKRYIYIYIIIKKISYSVNMYLDLRSNSGQKNSNYSI